jgi:hypothetical protein
MVPLVGAVTVGAVLTQGLLMPDTPSGNGTSSIGTWHAAAVALSKAKLL